MESIEVVIDERALLKLEKGCTYAIELGSYVPIAAETDRIEEEKRARQEA